MKNNILEFFRRGLTACGLGPVVLAVLYLILHHNGTVDVLTVDEVCRGIFSLTALAFIAGGMNIIYKTERIPLAVAILVHGAVLYLAYLATYLVNGWLEWGTAPITAFSAIFAVGYIAIWAGIYLATRKNTARINEKLKQKNVYEE